MEGGREGGRGREEEVSCIMLCFGRAKIEGGWEGRKAKKRRTYGSVLSSTIAGRSRGEGGMGGGRAGRGEEVVLVHAHEAFVGVGEGGGGGGAGAWEGGREECVTLQFNSHSFSRDGSIEKEDEGGREGGREGERKTYQCYR
jgi:hypothetical protein